jgi:hypothetical protein
LLSLKSNTCKIKYLEINFYFWFFIIISFKCHVMNVIANMSLRDNSVRKITIQIFLFNYSWDNWSLYCTSVFIVCVVRFGKKLINRFHLIQKYKLDIILLYSSYWRRGTSKYGKHG